MKKNIVTLTDSYKMTHHNQYDKHTEYVYSYFEARPGARFDTTTFFGLQYILKTWLEGQVVTTEKIDKAEKLASRHFSNPNIFDRSRWDYIVEKYDGRLPIEIKAVPEGSVIPINNVMMTVVNTDPNCYWLTNHLETLLCQVWYPSTVATLSRSVKDVFKKYLNETSDFGEEFPGLNFMLHDFGMRGVSSMESAALGGAGHLINFLGTDTVIAMEMIEQYYGGFETGFSVPACYDDKTEILTENGFVLFTELKKGIKVAQYNEDGTISFVYPTEYFNDRYIGKMVTFKSNGHKYFDAVVTPNHKMVRKLKRNDSVDMFEAGDLKKNFSSKNRAIISGVAIGDKEFTALDKLRIAFQADGSFSSRKDSYTGENTGTIPIRFSLKKKRKYDKLIDILKELHYSYSDNKYDNGYYSIRIQVPKDIDMYKDFSWINLSDLSKDYCLKFIDELQYWDGSLKNNCIIYSSTVKLNIDIVQSIASLCGKKVQISSYVDKRIDCNRKIIYSATISDKMVIDGSRSTRNFIDYDGRVYCVTVPSHMLVTRRNNSVLICGNTEHSVMTAKGEDGEKEVINQLLESYPTGIISVVSDSYDIYRCVDQYYGVDFKEYILAREGKFVVRPDSGDPVKVVCGNLNSDGNTLEDEGLLNILWRRFGGTINSKGYKVLHPKVGLIWGDGIDIDGITSILEAAKQIGFSAENLVFGMGGGLLQKINRDTQRFAFKSSAQMRDGVWYDVYKDPIEGGKSSKRGQLVLVKDDDGNYQTLRETEEVSFNLCHNSEGGHEEPYVLENEMKTVFINGEIVKEYNFSEVME